MDFLTQRAYFYGFATCKIEGEEATEVWRAVAGLFGLDPKEIQPGERFSANLAYSALKSADDVRLLQKCADEKFGGVFKLSAEEKQLMGLKYQALLKLEQLTVESRAATPLEAIALSYRRDSTAAILYSLQIFMHNEERRALGCEILSNALTVDRNSDAGLILLHVKQDERVAVYAKLAETPDMVLHPAALESLGKRYGIGPVPAERSTKFGF